ncbi:MAG: dockerin type I repeat-containing protein [Planctomycetota bacterium]
MARLASSAPLAICVVCLLAAPHCAAAVDLVYSFEDDLQGFSPNGGAFPVVQDTIGATEGSQSMLVDVPQPATFVGALTDQVEPFVTEDPLDFVVFDLTITEMFPADAAFVDAGITIFGSSQPDFPGGQVDGLQVQFENTQVQLQELEVGTHEIRIDLADASSPLTFGTGLGFNEIFGAVGSGQDFMVATGFQIYINKSPDAPWTGYFDNIRTAAIGEPSGGDYNGDGVVNAADYTVWRDNLAGGFGPDGDGTTTGDLLGVPDGVVDLSDYEFWAQEFGSTIGSAAVATPEPSAASLAVLSAAIAAFTGRRPTNSRP